ncbi:uncharacterized protein LOC116212080 [Punica granatum]|uniref:Uncharacterized protein LOC116212080 n=1 Tax=Punica granatum TaxID=22663 RepID=A0A6P8EB05_PUNGR|nr:uncharacterized protein LOC116212080 [Punica granatum]
MFLFCKSLKHLKGELKTFNKENYSDISKRVKKAECKLKVVQSKLLNGEESTDLLAAEQDLYHSYTELRSAKEAFFKQEALVRWLSLGDSNTGYFHKIVKARRSSHTIKVIFTENGIKLEDLTDISNEAVGFFQRLLGTKDPSVIGVDISTLQYILNFRLTLEQAAQLSRPVTEVEIKEVLWSMDSDSASGPDGSIGDNILLAHELVKGYDRTGASPRCAIKADIMKAFDFVDWNFLRCIFEAIGIPTIFATWVFEFIMGSRFSVLVNGGLQGYFNGLKGLRQGDPLSPYLFVMTIQVLTKILDKVAINGLIAYHPFCKKIQLTHLGFADDLLIFMKGELNSIKAVLDIFDMFYEMSGLRLNPAKTKIFCAGMEEQTIKHILNLSGLKRGSLPVRYLGVSLIADRIIDKDCKPLIEKITCRLQLVKSVIHSQVNFWCCAFVLPKKVLKKMEQKRKAFLLKEKMEMQGAKVVWDKVFLPKDEGGLGVKDFYTWNLSCNMKLIWLLFQKAGSLWIAWLNNYMVKGMSICSLKIPNGSSHALRKLLKIVSLFYPFLKHEIGDGQSTFFWFNNWTDRSPLFVEGSLYDIPCDAKLADALNNFVLTNIVSSEERRRGIQQLMTSTTVIPKKQDEIIWCATRKGKFSISGTWNELRNKSGKVIWYKLV